MENGVGGQQLIVGAEHRFFAHVGSKADVLKVSDEELQFLAGTMDFDHGVEGVDELTSVSYALRMPWPRMAATPG